MTDYPETDVPALKDQLEQLVELNNQREQALVQGYGIGLHPLNVMHARISALVQVILDEPGQLQLDILTQTVISNMLDAELNRASEQKNRSALLSGVPGVDPGLPQQLPADFLIRN
jgi:hypothetical protein